jgi:hypothetical protein
MKTAFLVTSGSYSDYQVHCVCPTEEDAKVVASKMQVERRDEYEIEERNIYDATIEPIEVLELSALITDDGVCVEEFVSTDKIWPNDEYATLAKPLSWWWQRTIYGIWGNKQQPGGRLQVWGTDFELVRKVYSDRRAMLMTDPAMRLRNRASGDKS